MGLNWKRPALGLGILLFLLAGLGMSLFPLAGRAQGEAWAPLTQGLWGGVIRTLAVSPQFAQDRTLFAGTEAGGVYRSLNAGDSWNAVNQGLTDLHIRSMAISPRFSTDRTLFVGTESGRLFRSTDAGTTWQELASPSSMPLTAIGLSPQYPSDPTIVLGFLNAGIFVSYDNGAHWLNTMWHRRAVVKFLFSPQYASDRTIWAVITWGGIYRSTDAGATWTLQTEGMVNNDFTALVLAMRGIAGSLCRPAGWIPGPCGTWPSRRALGRVSTAGSMPPPGRGYTPPRTAGHPGLT
jgi:photosystem II stability/assembly factor-like uncharacterized protein